MSELDLNIKQQPQQSKVDHAYSIWWGLKHDAKLEFGDFTDTKIDPAWKGTTKETFVELRRLIYALTDAEKKEFFAKIISASKNSIDNMNP